MLWPIENEPPDKDIISQGGWSNDHLARGVGEALDFAIPVGTPLVAIHDGMVTKVGWMGDAGIQVTMEWDEDGKHYMSRHCHLSQIPVSLGMVLQAGHRIAASGNSGKSTGSHLHLLLEADGIRIRLEDVYGIA